MATTKGKTATTPAPIFPLGDPEGVVRWTPAMLKKVFPRRELSLKPPKLDAPVNLVADLRANADAWWGHFEAGAELPGADAALHQGLREARAWLEDKPAKTKPSVELAALTYQLAVPGEMFRAESLAARLVDLWVGSFGLVFALEALAAAFTIAHAQGPSPGVAQSPAAKPRKGYGNGPAVAVIGNSITLIRASHNEHSNLRVEDIPDALAGKRIPSIHFVNDECRAWLRLREHLATAPEHDWSAAAAVAERLVAHPDVLVRHLVAFSFPERPAWAEALVAGPKNGVFSVLGACVRDPSKLPYVTFEYFFTEFERTAASLLAASGPRAVPHLVALTKRFRAAAQARYLLGLVAQVDTDEAVDALLALGDDAKAAAAVEAMRANFPERASARAKKR